MSAVGRKTLSQMAIAMVGLHGDFVLLPELFVPVGAGDTPLSLLLDLAHASLLLSAGHAQHLINH